MGFQSFEDILSWQKARELTRNIYAMTNQGSLARDYGLRDQMRRASVSILSNIAEGFERGGNREFSRFLSIAKGSAGELRAQLYVALDQSYIPTETHKSLTATAVEISRLIAGLMGSLRARDKEKGAM